MVVVMVVVMIVVVVVVVVMVVVMVVVVVVVVVIVLKNMCLRLRLMSHALACLMPQVFYDFEFDFDRSFFGAIFKCGATAPIPKKSKSTADRSTRF